MKKYQTEIRELNNTVIKLKNSLEGSAVDKNKQKKESLNLKTGHWKLFSLRLKKEKMKKNEESSYRAIAGNQYAYCGSPRRGREKETPENLFKEIIVGKSLNLRKEMNI